MCDPTPVRNWLIAIAVTIVAAVAVIIGAAVANGSWWYAWTSPIGMGVAAGLTGLAVFFCNRAIAALDAFCACAGARCAGVCSNLRAVLVAAAAVLGIQAAACLAAALVAWIPIVGQPVMYIISGALVIQVALIISAIAFMSQLNACQTSLTPPPSTKPPLNPMG